MNETRIRIVSDLLARAWERIEAEEPVAAQFRIQYALYMLASGWREADEACKLVQDYVSGRKTP